MKEIAEMAYIRMMIRLDRKVHIDAAGVIVEKEGKFLLVQEGSQVISEFYEKWNLPMGRMEKGENPEECALREGWEETGFFLKAGENIRPHRYQEGYTIRVGVIDIVAYIFEAKIIGGKLKVPSDLLDVRFFSFNEIEDLKKQGKLISSYVLSAIADYNELVFKRQASQDLKVQEQK